MQLSLLLLVAAATTALWSLFAYRFSRWRVAPALVLAFSGAVTAKVAGISVEEPLSSPVTERAVEMILALLLFLDATEVKGGLLGREPRSALRLILLALPLSLLAATALGVVVFPGVAVAIVVIMACAVMPTDLSASGQIFANRLVPRRVSQLLNVESGYNDGIVAPIFVCALVLVDHASGDRAFWDAAGEGLYSTAIAIVIGVAIGLLAAVAANIALARSLTSTRALGITVLLTALLAYGTAVELSGNGFVSAFVCGIAYRAMRDVDNLGTSELEFVEDFTLLCNVAMWFGFGLLIDFIFELGWPGWPVVVFAVAAITVLRGIPVLATLDHEKFRKREKAMVAFLGPRGTASIVFGLLAWIKISDEFDEEASIVLFVTVWTVALSLIVYSATAITLATQNRRARAAGG